MNSRQLKSRFEPEKQGEINQECSEKERKPLDYWTCQPKKTMADKDRKIVSAVEKNNSQCHHQQPPRQNIRIVLSETLDI